MVATDNAVMVVEDSIYPQNVPVIFAQHITISQLQVPLASEVVEYAVAR